ncbi:DEAD/DEAH box helicase [Brackiella oedipodis]|uniref:DEAD/DEAH box helicase n=1 Tax=Brackiella oedipodis TaxID=124225 RepID=UPI00048DE9F5|nr:type ISP restriction/modification enzyme [Brackiella oedipodis]
MTTVQTPLQKLLQQMRTNPVTRRDQGTDFEHLCCVYLRNEPFYQDLYAEVWTYGQWAATQGLSKKDTGIDLVAQTREGEVHAIQCKNYGPNYSIKKADIDSFMTASGKKPFSHRLIITTTDEWSDNAIDALDGQNTPVSMISYTDLERSVIDWRQFSPNQEEVVCKPKFELRSHQKDAYKDVEAGFAEQDRGKLIMACGTGKTFTALRIAEGLTGPGKRVLFMVPSLALLAQTVTEWTQQSKVPLHNYAVCSDSEVGKHKNYSADLAVATISDLQYPATTNAHSLAQQVQQRHDPDHLSVVYATYHSVDVIAQAQQQYGLGEFDLIICDEAHRTTGVTYKDDKRNSTQEESTFVRIHDNDYVRGCKRLYMTATPRVYSESSKQSESIQVLYSMDDKEHFGETFHVVSFNDAVQQGLLVDYKVIVLAIDEEHISGHLQQLLSDENNQLVIDDAAKIVGCWKALAKYQLDSKSNNSNVDLTPMKRAVAFCQVIEDTYKGKGHRVSSKLIARMFSEVVKAYQAQEKAVTPDYVDPNPVLDMVCEAEHVDGSMNATKKEEKINWLKGENGQIPDNECRILTNVRCLSEGVDIPALDAVMFMTPRNSLVDVVQSVGRVMRRAPDKRCGYVILPVVIPAGAEASTVLDNNEQYKVIWQVLNALRSHDEDIDADINKLMMGNAHSKIEVIAVTDAKPAAATLSQSPEPTYDIGRDHSGELKPDETLYNEQLSFTFGNIERAIVTRIVEKCGNRHYWEDWAKDIAQIAERHITRIRSIVSNPENREERRTFEQFATAMRENVNNELTDDDLVQMLAQHVVTKPVFDALFEDYDFAAQNPVSQAMQAVLTKLEGHHLNKEAKSLERFYQSVRRRAQGIESAQAKQALIIELYDKFFRTAFPKMADKLGIVYTPVEIVDFIVQSAEQVMQQEFGKSLGDEGVHILDPFTGTGSFITRLLQSGIIPKEKLPYKFKHDIHANEITLLAYYVAAINIESVYHGILSGKLTSHEDQSEITEVAYEPFPGICLTDTFKSQGSHPQLYSEFEDNNKRRKAQEALGIQVIMGNPPYSAGQRNANENNANAKYEKLDERINVTYAAKTQAALKRSLYDSYVRAIRWASDRINDQGMIAFITNGGFIDAKAMDGLRKCLAQEFSSLYIFNLRGKSAMKGGGPHEGGSVFGIQTAVAIAILIKNPQAKQFGQIYYHPIEDDLSGKEKLDRIKRYASLQGIANWETVTPDENGDWINQRDPELAKYMIMGDKKNQSVPVIFENYSRGLATSRDPWVYNSSKTKLSENIQSMLAFYNAELERLGEKIPTGTVKQRTEFVKKLAYYDPQKISWTYGLFQALSKQHQLTIDFSCFYRAAYRPFYKQWVYFNQFLNERGYQLPSIFPNKDSENLVILVNANYGGEGLPVFISDKLPDLHVNGDAQCFPLYLYEPKDDQSHNDLLTDLDQKEGSNRRNAITDKALAHFQSLYTETITKEDLFYYIYGLLHSPDYIERFKTNLSKELPRIPRVKHYADFMAFSQAGRQLADLHINYEQVQKYPVRFTGKLAHDGKDFVEADDSHFYVEKMKHPKIKDPETGKKVNDLTRIIYNKLITVEGIPEEAYDYVISGQSAIKCVMDRQAVRVDKDSGIINDANDWAKETMHNPRYPLELLQRVITVSLETIKIIKSLPRLQLDEDDPSPCS